MKIIKLIIPLLGLSQITDANRQKLLQLGKDKNIDISYQILEVKNESDYFVEFEPKITQEIDSSEKISQSISDFSTLATTWTRECLAHCFKPPLYLEWIDFDAEQKITKAICQSENTPTNVRLKDCKLEIKQKDFSIDKVHEPTKGKHILFQQSYINNSSEPDQITINEQSSYEDYYH